MATQKEVAIQIKAADRASKVMRDVESRGERMTASLRKAGAIMTGMGAAMGAGLGLAIKTTAGFEQSLANVQSVAGATSEELAQLTSHARKMGAQSVFSAKQAADAMYFLASAGMNTEKIMGSLEGTLALAAATQSDLAFTTATVASTLSAYGLQAREASRVANSFAATISASQATMGKLATSMNYIGPIAKSINMSLEETTGILGQLYNQGLDASTAGTSLRQSIARLLKPTDAAKAALAGMGVSAVDSTGQLRPFVDIVRQLETAGMTTAQAMEIFGMRAGPAMLALVSKGADAIEVLTEKITDTNKAAEMAEMQINTFQGQLKMLKSAAEELQIAIGTTLLPMLTDFVKKVTEIVRDVGAWSTEHPKLTEALAKFALVMSGMMVAGGPMLMLAPTILTITLALQRLSIAAGTAGAAGALSYLTTSLAPILAIAVPIALGIAGIGAAIGAVAWALNEYRKAKKDVFTQREMETIASNVRGIESAIKDYESAIGRLEELSKKGNKEVSLLGLGIRNLGSDVRPIPANIQAIEEAMATAILEFRELKGDTYGAATAMRDWTKGLIDAKDIINWYQIQIGAIAKSTATVADETASVATKLKALQVGMKAAQAFLPELEITMPKAEPYWPLMFPSEEDLIGAARSQAMLNGLAQKTATWQLELAEEVLSSELAKERAKIDAIRKTNREKAAAAAMERQLAGNLADFHADMSEQLLRSEFDRQVKVEEGVKELNSRITAAAIERQQYEDATIGGMRDAAFYREQQRIRSMTSTYMGWINTAIQVGEQLFSQQEGGWLRAFALVVRYATRVVAAYLRELAFEKLKQAEQKMTRAEWMKGHSERMTAMAAEAQALAIMATAAGNFVSAGLYETAAALAASEAAYARIASGVLESSARIMQGEAATMMAGAVAVEAAGAIAATGLESAARATSQAAQQRQEVLEQERRLQQDILTMQDRQAEAQLMGLEAQLSRYRDLGVRPGILGQWEALSRSQISEQYPPTGAGTAVSTGVAQRTSYQTNYFYGITNPNDKEQMREYAKALWPHIQELEDLGTSP